MSGATRGFAGSVFVAGLTLTGCSAGAGTVVPAELGALPPSPSVTAPAMAIAPPATTAPSATLTAPGSTTEGTVTPSSEGTAVPTSPGDTVPIESAAPSDVGPRFGPDLGIAVSAAPSVRSSGDTRQLLPEGLWVHLAWEPDPTDAAVFTPLPEDVPILEAYSKAQLAYYRAALGLSAPDAPELDRYFVDGTTRFADAFAARAAAGRRLWLGSGVVLRPYVLGDQRSATDAVVLDCYLHDEQELPIGAAPTSGPLRPYALVATMVLIDGRWKLDRTGTEAGVCL